MTSKNDEENKALETQNAPEQTDEPTSAPEQEPKAPTKAKKSKVKAINIDSELANRTTGATGYRAYYHQMMKDKK